MSTRPLSAALALGAFLLTPGCMQAQRMAATGVADSLAGTVNASWDQNAAVYRGQNGMRYAYVCGPGGSAGFIWGTDVYSDDSSVCTAGVHAGAITLAGGGRVVIEIRPGQGSYAASTRYGIETGSWGAWSGSFTVVNARH